MEIRGDKTMKVWSVSADVVIEKWEVGEETKG